MFDNWIMKSLVCRLLIVAAMDQYRPLIHYTPKSNWMNDPNGLVFYDGEWHLFYQHYPHEAKAKNIHWGHAVSKDLVRWKELSIALIPEDELVGLWSGSAVIDWKNQTGVQRDSSIDPMIAIFTWQKRGWQEQHMAFSLDRGRTWTRYPENPVIPLNVNVSFPTDSDLNASVIVFRDPKLIFHSKTNAWIALISGGDHIQFHRSTDLIHWTLQSRFGYTDGSHAGVWECPDLIEFSQADDRNRSSLWILIVSIDRNAVAGGSGMQYFLGTFDGYTFKNLQSASKINWLDYGPDFYAGITYHNVPHYDDRRVMIAWMNNWQYAQDVPTGPDWRGQMAFPRQLELDVDSDRQIFQLRQKPVQELFSMSKRLITFSGELLNSCSENLLGKISSQTFMLNSEFHRIDRHSRIRFRVRQDREENEFTEINYNGERNRLELDRSRSGEIDFHPLFRTKYALDLDEEILVTGIIQIQLIVDRCSVEIFVNRGRWTLTALIFPKYFSDEIELLIDGETEIRLEFLEVMLF